MLIDLIESKVSKLLSPKPKKKPSENICSIFFENKGYLRDQEIDKSLPTSSEKFPTPMVNYKLIPPLSTKRFNFNKFDD